MKYKVINRLLYIQYYTITWLPCAFSLVVDRYLLKETHTDDDKSTSDHVSGLDFLFHAPKSFTFQFLLYKEIYNIFRRVCTVMDHRRHHSA